MWNLTYTSTSLASVTIAGAILTSISLSETDDIIELNKLAVVHLTFDLWLTIP